MASRNNKRPTLDEAQMVTLALRLDRAYQDACIIRADRTTGRYDGAVDALRWAGYDIIRRDGKHTVTRHADAEGD